MNVSTEINLAGTLDNGRQNEPFFGSRRGHYQHPDLNDVLLPHRRGAQIYVLKEDNFGFQERFKQEVTRFAAFPDVTQSAVSSRATVYKLPAEFLISPERFQVSDGNLERMFFGSHSYPLKNQVSATALQNSTEAWQFIVEGFPFNFAGHGFTQEHAKRDFERKVHVAFQKLFRKRPFQMTTSEHEDWAVLEKYIDIAAYKRATPVIFRETGCVQRVLNSGFIEVKWLNERVEQFSLETSPPEFAAYEVGQWFEAYVERKSGLRGDLLRLSNPVPIEPIEKMEPDELKKFWSEIEPLKPTADFSSL
jgi:hypothetical protein